MPLSRGSFIPRSSLSPPNASVARKYFHCCRQMLPLRPARSIGTHCSRRTSSHTWRFVLCTCWSGHTLDGTADGSTQFNVSCQACGTNTAVSSSLRCNYNSQVFLRFDSGYSSHDSLWRHSLLDFGNILPVGGKRCLSAAFGILWLLLLPNAGLCADKARSALPHSVRSGACVYVARNNSLLVTKASVAIRNRPTPVRLQTALEAIW